ncbi:MAG: hypothetical protein ACI88C_001399 [Acidimicrobiales bacterium]|jgi:hypothetical protein
MLSSLHHALVGQGEAAGIRRGYHGWLFDVQGNWFQTHENVMIHSTCSSCTLGSQETSS